MDAPNDSLPPASSPPPRAPVSLRDWSQPNLFFGPNGLRAGWRLLLFFAILYVFYSVPAFVIRLIAHGRIARTAITTERLLLGEGLLFASVLAASWVMARIEGRRLADYGLPVKQLFKAKFWIGTVIGFVSLSALLGAMRLADSFHVDGIALHGVDLWKYAVLWGLAFLFVAFFEEFFFRGYALFTITTGIGFWPAALLSSLAFGYVHHANPGENWVGEFAAGLVGLFLCVMLRGTGDLWMPIGFHAAWDWAETFFYGVPDSGQVAPGHLFNASFSGPEWLTGGSVGPEGSWLCVALIVLLGIIFVAWFRESKYPNAKAIPDPRHHAPIAIFDGPGTLTGPDPG